jgi:hypothetical protein
VNENKQNKNMNQNQQQQNNQQRPKDLESQGEQKGAQQIPSSQRDVTRK